MWDFSECVIVIVIVTHGNPGPVLAPMLKDTESNLFVASAVLRSQTGSQMSVEIEVGH